MGSPLSPVTANVCMQAFGNSALMQAPLKCTCFYHYVDDMFVVWLHGSEKLDEDVVYLNNFHANIKFVEVEHGGGLPFLDIFSVP